MHHRLHWLAALLLPVTLLPMAGCDGSKLLGVLLSQGAGNQPGSVSLETGAVAITIEALPGYQVKAGLADLAYLKVVLLQAGKANKVVEIPKDQILSGQALAKFESVSPEAFTVEVTAYDAQSKVIGTAKGAGKAESAKTTTLTIKLSLADSVIEVVTVPPPGNVDAKVEITEGYAVTIESIALPATPSLVVADPTGGYWVSAAFSIFKVGPLGDIPVSIDGVSSVGPIAVNASGSVCAGGYSGSWPDVRCYGPDGKVIGGTVFEGGLINPQFMVAASDGTFWFYAPSGSTNVPSGFLRHLSATGSLMPEEIAVSQPTGLAIMPSGAFALTLLEGHVLKTALGGESTTYPPFDYNLPPFLNKSFKNPQFPAVTADNDILFVNNDGKEIGRSGSAGTATMSVPALLQGDTKGLAANSQGGALLVTGSGIRMFSATAPLWSHTPATKPAGAGSDAKGNTFFWGTKDGQGRLCLVKVKGP